MPEDDWLTVIVAFIVNILTSAIFGVLLIISNHTIMIHTLLQHLEIADLTYIQYCVGGFWIKEIIRCLVYISFKKE